MAEVVVLGAGLARPRDKETAGIATISRLAGARRVRARRLPLAVAAVLLLSACGLGQGLQQVVKDRYRLSVLTLNIAGALPEYSSNPEIPFPWRERYSRIAAGFKTQGLAPDIVALQEATARKEWVLSRDPDEHESLHYLITKLQATIGVRYRIAYLGAADTNHPGLVQGQAVLYNLDRLRNATAAPVSQVQPGNSRPQKLGVQPRRSYPCDAPAEEFKDSCPLLDGEGVYWTSVFAGPGGAKHFETGFVRFAFASDQESQFNFYNVHLHPEIPGSVEAATALIDFAESVKLGGHTTYPPLVVGDFNGGPERFPTFDTLGAVDVDHVIGGQRASHAATYGFSVVGAASAPGAAPNPDGMCAPRDVAWSDHCALVVNIEPAP